MTGRGGTVAAIMAKDTRLFLRDRFFVVITLLAMVAYVVIFWLLPTTVDETVEIGVHQEGIPLFEQASAGSGLAVTAFATTDALRAAVETGENGIVAGLDFPDDFAARIAVGETVRVTQFVRSGTPDEVTTALSSLAREVVATLEGNPPPFDLLASDVVVLGPDRAGDQVSLQDRMRPLLAVFVLIVEALALASLVASEIEQRTVTAILVSPATVTDFVAAKSLFGAILAFVETTVLLALIGALGANTPPLLLAVLLGGVLVTGVALIAGSLGRDFIEIVFWSIAFMIPLMIPGFAALFPGSAAAWVKVMPSYGLARSVVELTTYRAGWADVAPYLLGLAAWCAVLFGAGVIVLRRKVQTL